MPGSAPLSEAEQHRPLHCRVLQSRLGACRPETQTGRFRQSVRRRSWDSAPDEPRGLARGPNTKNVCAEKLLPWERPRQVFPDATSWGSAQTAAKNPDRLHPQTRGHRSASSPDPTQRLPPRVSRAEGQGRCWGKGCVFQLTSSVSRFFPPKFSFPLEFFFFSLSDFYYTHQNSNPRSKSLSSYPLSITRMS